MGAHRAVAACGSDPGDADAIATTRSLIGAQCDCATASSHSQYTKCARSVISDAIKGGILPRSCASAVQRCATQSTCGRGSGFVPCCKASLIGGSSCTISRDTGCNGTSCRSAATSCCDACVGNACFQVANATPTPTPTPDIPEEVPLICQPALAIAVPFIQLPVTTEPGTDDCGGPLATHQPNAPRSGSVTDSSVENFGVSAGKTISDLGLGCLYVGGLPPTKIPGGSTSILGVTGLANGSALGLLLGGILNLGAGVSIPQLPSLPTNFPSLPLPLPNIPLPQVPNLPSIVPGLFAVPSLGNIVGLTLGPHKGSGPVDCTFGAGPGHHCSNGAAGSDGMGACRSDADCLNRKNACNLDANCYFGPPVPVPNGVVSACIVNVFKTGLCGTAYLPSPTMLTTTLSARVYFGPVDSPCPLCVNNTCTSGESAGKPCVVGGDSNTSIDCLPRQGGFVDTLTVSIPLITTGVSHIAASDGLFCTDQATIGALGLPNAKSVEEVGAELSPAVTLSSTALSLPGLSLPSLMNVPTGATITAQETIGATFCVPPTGGPLDGQAGLPTLGALSARANLDIPNVLVIPGASLP